jgi:hypothetical protein
MTTYLRKLINLFNLNVVSTSNGKSSIVEEQLYSFLKFIFSFFLFYAITNEDVCFASIL